MTDYGNATSGPYMPGDEPQERSDRTPRDTDTELVCTCPGISFTLLTIPGPHHDDGCPFHELPDYGVFGPDE
jgi:hypothetical protein